MNLVNFTAREENNKAFISLANSLHKKLLPNKSRHGPRQVAPIQKENLLALTQGVQVKEGQVFMRKHKLKSPTLRLRTIGDTGQSLVLPDEFSLHSATNDLRVITNPSSTNSKVRRLLLKEHPRKLNKTHLTACKLKILPDPYPNHKVSDVTSINTMQKVIANNIESSEMRTAEASQRTLKDGVLLSYHDKFDTRLLRNERQMDKITECEQEEVSIDIERVKRKMQVLDKEGLFLFPVFDYGKSFSGAELAVYEVKFSLNCFDCN
jgi:hypothetical protein